jgi:hypothetical protein
LRWIAQISVQTSREFREKARIRRKLLSPDASFFSSWITPMEQGCKVRASSAMTMIQEYGQGIGKPKLRSGDMTARRPDRRG